MKNLNSFNQLARALACAFVLLAFHPAQVALLLYANPIISTMNGTDSTQISSVWLGQSGVSEIAGSECGSSSGQINMDKIRVGDTWRA